MTIEATLLSIDATLKALLASVQAGAQMAAEFSGAEPGASRKRRTKAGLALTPIGSDGYYIPIKPVPATKA